MGQLIVVSVEKWCKQVDHRHFQCLTRVYFRKNGISQTHLRRLRLNSGNIPFILFTNSSGDIALPLRTSYKVFLLILRQNYFDSYEIIYEKPGESNIALTTTTDELTPHIHTYASHCFSNERLLRHKYAMDAMYFNVCTRI